MVEHTLGHILKKNRQRFKSLELNKSCLEASKSRKQNALERPLETEIISRVQSNPYQVQVEVKPKNKDLAVWQKSAVLLDIIKEAKTAHQNSAYQNTINFNERPMPSKQMTSKKSLPVSIFSYSRNSRSLLPEPKRARDDAIRFDE